MKYKKTLNALLAIIAVALSSAVCAVTKTPLPAGPTTVVSYSNTTVPTSQVRFSINYTVSSLNPVSLCVFVPRYLLLMGNEIRIPVPMIAESTYFNSTCGSPGTNAFYNPPSGAVAAGNLSLAVNSMSLLLQRTNVYVSQTGSGNHSNDMMYRSFHLSNKGVRPGDNLTLNVYATVNGSSVLGLYSINRTGLVVAGTTRPGAQVPVMPDSTIGPVSTISQTVAVDAKGWNIDCAVNENCGSVEIFDIVNQGGASANPQIRFDNNRTSTCTGATGVGYLQKMIGGTPSGLIYSGLNSRQQINPSQHVKLNYEIPVASHVCQTTDRITLNVSLP